MSIKMTVSRAWAGCAIALMQIGLSLSVAASEYAAGSLVSYDPIEIILVRQDLQVSPDLVRVTYVLRSRAGQPQTATLAFPMPPVSIQPGPDFLGGAEINEADPRNYLHFDVRVDDQPAQTNLVESAYLGEADVGDALRAAGLPLLLPPDEASALIAALPAEQFYPLVEGRLVSLGGDDPPHVTPLWSYQASIEWRQDFLPGEKTIEISYQPLVGIVENPTEFLGLESTPAKYCIGEDLREEVAKHTQAGENVEVLTFSHRMSMTPFWQGPIGTFNLAAERSGDGSFVAYCPPGGEQGSSVREFTPSRDLDVAYITFRRPP